MAKHFTRGKYRDEERIIGPSLDAIENAYDVLCALPEYDSVTFFRLEDHQKAADANDLQKGFFYLFLDVFNWLKFFWYTSAYKTRQLTTSLISAYNTDNFLGWMVLGRSTLEYAAVSYYFVKKIKQLQLDGPHFAASQIKSLEDSMLQYAHGTRFDWQALLSGDRERMTQKFSSSASQQAVNVLTAISHLARRDARYKDVEVAYNMLSDFVHPNMASHATVLEMPTVPGDVHHTDIAAQPGALRGEFLMVLSLPWVSVGVGTTVELLTDVAPLVHRWLDYVDKGTQISIDFTK